MAAACRFTYTLKMAAANADDEEQHNNMGEEDEENGAEGKPAEPDDDGETNMGEEEEETGALSPDDDDEKEENVTTAVQMDTHGLPSAAQFTPTTTDAERERLDAALRRAMTPSAPWDWEDTDDMSPGHARRYAYRLLIGDLTMAIAPWLTELVQSPLTVSDAEQLVEWIEKLWAMASPQRGNRVLDAVRQLWSSSAIGFPRSRPQRIVLLQQTVSSTAYFEWSKKFTLEGVPSWLQQQAVVSRRRARPAEAMTPIEQLCQLALAEHYYVKTQLRWLFRHAVDADLCTAQLGLMAENIFPVGQMLHCTTKHERFIVQAHSAADTRNGIEIETKSECTGLLYAVNLFFSLPGCACQKPYFGCTPVYSHVVAWLCTWLKPGMTLFVNSLDSTLAPEMNIQRQYAERLQHFEIKQKAKDKPYALVLVTVDACGPLKRVTTWWSEEHSPDGKVVPNHGMRFCARATMCSNVSVTSNDPRPGKMLTIYSFGQAYQDMRTVQELESATVDVANAVYVLPRDVVNLIIEYIDSSRCAAAAVVPRKSDRKNSVFAKKRQRVV